MILVEKTGDQFKKLSTIISQYKGKKIGILSTERNMDWGNHDSNILHVHLGDSPFEIAQRLFNGLLDMENQSLTALLVQGVSESETGLAIMNRLRKAASEII